MKFLIASFCFILVSNASDIKVFGTKTTSFNLQNSEIAYIINAQEYVLNNDALRKEYHFFNRKLMAQMYHYRHNGDFQTQNITLSFQKAYKYNGGFVFEGASFKDKDTWVKAKECFYEYQKLTCSKIKYFKDNQIIQTKLSGSFDSTSF